MNRPGRPGAPVIIAAASLLPATGSINSLMNSSAMIIRLSNRGGGVKDEGGTGRFWVAWRSERAYNVELEKVKG